MFDERSYIRISQDKLQLLFESVVSGLPIKVAMERAGLPVFYYYKWLSIYENFIEELEQKEDAGYNEIENLNPRPLIKDGETIGNIYTPVSLINELKKAQAEWVSGRNEFIMSGATGWQSASWLLERRLKSEYSTSDVDTNEKKTITSIKVVYVDPNTDKDRLEKLEQEVKENINGSNT